MCIKFKRSNTTVVIEFKRVATFLREGWGATDNEVWYAGKKFCGLNSDYRTEFTFLKIYQVKIKHIREYMGMGMGEICEND